MPVQKLQDQPGVSKKTMRQCYRCGGAHDQAQCRFLNAECHACGKKGHISRVCRSKARVQPKQESKPVHVAEEFPSPDDSPEYFLYPVRASSVSPLQTTVTINNKDVHMEVDTGASLMVISENTVAKIWRPNQAPTLQPTTVKLRTYTGSEIPVVGTMTVKVQHYDQQLEMPLVVVAGSGPSLLGRDWLA